MAVETTVEVVMPAMGDSVSEGTILEWHKKEGDQVSEDETLVEISTDKVDAEVPAPASGTVVKLHAAEGDTVHVGAVLAEISAEASAGGEAAGRDRGAAPAAEEAPAEAEAEPEPEGEAVEITMPAMGESVSEGVILEWAKQPGDRGRGRRDDRRDQHRQGRRRSAGARLGRDGGDPRQPGRHRDGRSGDRADEVRRRTAAKPAAAARGGAGQARRAGGAAGGGPARRHPRLARRATRGAGRGHRPVATSRAAAPAGGS